MTEFDFERISKFLPQYLSAKEQASLYAQLRGDPTSMQFYEPGDRFLDDLMQGDGWRGLVATDFLTLAQRAVSGVILSNSCDIDVRNRHDFPPNILFVPLIALSKVRQRFVDRGISSGAIESKLSDMRRQRVSNVFYLPAKSGVMGDSIVLFDDVHRHPLEHFISGPKTKLFGLSMAAFYMFLIKISIHFHRVQENEPRFIP